MDNMDNMDKLIEYCKTAPIETLIKELKESGVKFVPNEANEIRLKRDKEKDTFD